MQRAHQALPVLLDHLAVEVPRAMLACKVPQVDCARLVDKDLQGQRGRQVLRAPLQAQPVIQGPSGRLVPPEAWVLMVFLSQALKASRD